MRRGRRGRRCVVSWSVRKLAPTFPPRRHRVKRGALRFPCSNFRWSFCPGLHVDGGPMIVAQISNLLYRRFLIGRASQRLTRLKFQGACGLQTRDTADWKSALPEPAARWLQGVIRAEEPVIRARRTRFVSGKT